MVNEYNIDNDLFNLFLKFTDFTEDATKKNDNILLINEIFKGMLNLLDLWKLEQERVYYQWLLYNIELYSKCKRKEHIPYIADSIVKFTEEIIEVPNIEEKLKYIHNIPVIEQRTDEWYHYRHSVITASSMGKLFDTPSAYTTVLKEKVLPFKMNRTAAACEHGVRFEPIAQSIYELMHNLKISEYGCIKHQFIDYIGASPDGIVTESNDKTFLGRMLEIKCLYSRVMTGVPPYMYWIQVQTQLEVCNLEYCDFLECKINDNLSESEFFNYLENKDNNNPYTNFYGIVIAYEYNSKIEYVYSEIGMSIESLKEWKNNLLDKLISDENVNFRPDCGFSRKGYWFKHESFWILHKHNIVTIKRNRDWFNLIKPIIKSFWEDVEQKRIMYETDKNLFVKKSNTNSIAIDIELDKENIECLIDDEY